MVAVVMVAAALSGPQARAVGDVVAASGTVAACSTAVASGPRLGAVRTGFVVFPTAVYGVAAARSGSWSFVDEYSRPPIGRVAVLSDRSLTPRVVRTIDVPRFALGNSVTRDGRYLLIADDGAGATVVSVPRAERGASDTVLGTLEEPGNRGAHGGAFEVTSSLDGRYAFVSVEDGDAIAVYDLRAALADGFQTSSYVGSVPLGEAVVGMAVSPDGRWLYATSELAANRRLAQQDLGTLSVISIATAERDPARAVVATVAAQCQPVRVAVSPDGQLVWVTARASDQLLAFSAAKLRTDPAHALQATVRVGEAPVGLAVVADGRDVIVADSNRFSVRGAGSELTVVSTTAALANRPAILGTIPAGGFPREMTLEPGGRTLLVSNTSSRQLEAVAVDKLR